MPRNHLSQRHRRRRFRRLHTLLTKRCANCRRKLDPAFRWVDAEPWCSVCSK